jgi:HAD superfamily hydrolase (TIGR01509 family)
MASALLFDLDGTLIDSDPLHAPVFIELFAELGHPIDEDYYLTHIHGRLNAETFGRHFPHLDALELSDRKEQIFRARLGDSHPPMPGLPDLIDRARATGLRTALVTNAPRANADAMLAAIGMAGRLDTIVLADDCPRGKPSPDPYLEALRRLDVPAEMAIAFEDSPSGIAAAVAAGIFTVGITSSLSPDALRAAGAHDTITDYTDPKLPAILARLERT